MPCLPVYLQKLNLGIFNKKKVYIQYTAVKDNIENEIKKVIKMFRYFGKSSKSLLSNKNNATNNTNLQNNSNNINNNVNNFNNLKSYFNDEECLIDEIYKKSEVFGENIFAMVNFFTYNRDDKKIIHMLDGLNIADLLVTQNDNFQKEYFFENFSRFFRKIETYCNRGEIPHDFDIFTTKHSNSKSFDILINIFTKKETLNESDLESCKIKYPLIPL